MIFGFNTDIKHDSIVYHVQSEARHADLLLQTQVFVRGRCIGKHATSYAERRAAPGFSDDTMHEMLKIQHKNIIESIRAGNIDNLFAPTTVIQKNSEAPIKAEVTEAAKDGGSLLLEWLNSDAVYNDGAVVMKFLVSRQENDRPVPAATLTSRLHMAGEVPIYSQAVTDADGQAEMRIVLPESALAQASVLIQAVHGAHQATRKFRLKKQ